MIGLLSRTVPHSAISCVFLFILTFPSIYTPSMHLKPLHRHFEDMEKCEFLELDQKIAVIFQLICLIWSHSSHYQKPARLVVLLQEVSNLLVQLVSPSCSAWQLICPSSTSKDLTYRDPIEDQCVYILYNSYMLLRRISFNMDYIRLNHIHIIVR